MIVVRGFVHYALVAFRDVGHDAPILELDRVGPRSVHLFHINDGPCYPADLLIRVRLGTQVLCEYLVSLEVRHWLQEGHVGQQRKGVCAVRKDSQGLWKPSRCDPAFYAASFSAMYEAKHSIKGSRWAL